MTKSTINQQTLHMRAFSDGRAVAYCHLGQGPMVVVTTATDPAKVNCLRCKVMLGLRAA